MANNHVLANMLVFADEGTASSTPIKIKTSQL